MPQGDLKGALDVLHPFQMVLVLVNQLRQLLGAMGRPLVHFPNDRLSRLGGLPGVGGDGLAHALSHLGDLRREVVHHGRQGCRHTIHR